MFIGVYGETHMSYNIVCTTTTTTRCLSTNAFLLCVTVQARPWRATWLMLLALEPPNGGGSGGSARGCDTSG